MEWFGMWREGCIISGWISRVGRCRFGEGERIGEG